MKTVRCSCGHIASGDTAEQLLQALEAHINATHARQVADVLIEAETAYLDGYPDNQVHCDASRYERQSQVRGQLLKEEPWERLDPD
jgi:hypothetical protein